MKIESILVRGTNWIGDAVMTTPALLRLRSSFPKARIALLATPRTTGLFEGSPYLDQIIEYRRREDGVGAFFKAVGSLREHRFDLAVLFQNAFEAALLASLGGVRYRIGFAEQGRGWLLTHRLERGERHKNRHQVHDYLEIVAKCEEVCLGHDFVPRNENPLPSLTASVAQTRAAEDLRKSYRIDSSSRPLILLNAGATNSRAKCWSGDRFAALADRLSEHAGAMIVLIGGAGELSYAEGVAREVKNAGVINLAGKTSLAELVGLLDACDLLISNDTGPAHIAAALGRPTMTIFGPTNEFETAPSGERAELIRADGVECARCMLRDCPIDHRCMTRISPDQVFDRARILLEDERRKSVR